MIALWLAVAGAQHPADGIPDAVSADRLEADLRALTGDTTDIVSRYVCHPDVQLAQDYVIASFSDIDRLEIRTEPVQMETDFPTANVVAELPGRDDQAGWVVVGAHYDSIASFDESWDPLTDPAPGADDDASGVAAVLEIARLLAAWKPGFERSLRFVAFTGEEIGLLGAYEHVDGIDARSEDVHVALILDPVGYNAGDADRIWVSYDLRYEDHAVAVEETGARIESPLEVWPVDQAMFGGDDRSDHYPFWLADHAALHLGVFPLPPTYHTMDDTLDNVDVAFLVEVTALTAAHAADEAIPRERRLACGCASGGGATAGWWLPLVVAMRRRTMRPRRN